MNAVVIITFGDSLINKRIGFSIVPGNKKELLKRIEEQSVKLGILEYRHVEAENKTFTRLTPSFQ
ncbi:MAG: hypothetical protein WBX01_14505 [Nitrososphaeraceae archaeon]